MGFVRVANETMCRPIRALTQMKGYDVAQHCLACFGGAGGQHACAIAQNLGMRTIFVHRYAGVLSAVGIGLADVVAEEQVLPLPLIVLCIDTMLTPSTLWLHMGRLSPQLPTFAPHRFKYSSPICNRGPFKWPASFHMPAA